MHIKSDIQIPETVLGQLVNLLQDVSSDYWIIKRGVKLNLLLNLCSSKRLNYFLYSLQELITSPLTMILDLLDIGLFLLLPDLLY